jgi:hypothetical protein
VNLLDKPDVLIVSIALKVGPYPLHLIRGWHESVSPKESSNLGGNPP